MQTDFMRDQADIRATMAVGTYKRIRLAENPDISRPWGPQFVGLNGYTTRIPRGVEVIASEYLVSNLYDSAAAGRTEIMLSEFGTLTAEQAHEQRLLGKIPVFPEKIDVNLLSR